MTPTETLAAYRKCFEACGIELPGYRWSADELQSIRFGDCSGCSSPNPYGATHSEGTFHHPQPLWAEAALAVCRVAAEDWLRNRHCKEGTVLSLTDDEDPIEVKIDWFDGEEMQCRGESHGNIHSALIALCEAVAGKEPKA